MKLTSPAFVEGGYIPAKYTCDDANISPALSWSDVPSESKTLVLILSDPDAPAGVWDHWLLVNIPSNITQIPEAYSPSSGIVTAKNSWGHNRYDGPCPPSGIHRYIFTLYALNSSLNLNSNSSKTEILDAVQEHILAQATLMGRYKRAN